MSAASQPAAGAVPSFQYTLANGSVLSTVDRQVNDVSEPRRHFLENPELFIKDEAGRDVIDTAVLRQHFFEEGRLTEAQVLGLLKLGTEILRREPNLIEAAAPITIVGDMHGQYYDLMKVFEVAGGEPPSNSMLFLGDYVDRGYFSFECFFYLLALKIRFPQQVFLLRGNHESRNLTRHFTFKLECVYKYNEVVYNAVMEAFDCLPLAGLVNGQFFCAHGGISPDMSSPHDLNTKLNRFCDPPRAGLGCDILWADPTENFGDEGHKEDFVANGTRGCSYRYSFQGVCRFLKRNGLLSIIRGHEAQIAGYRLYQNAKDSEFPALMTIFSAANYVDTYKNKGAILKYDGKVLNIRQYEAVPHPYYLPKFMNAFDWSLPFLGEKMAELFMSVLNLPTKQSKIEGITPEEKALLHLEFDRRQRNIKNKIKAVARVNRMFQTVRNERETLTELMDLMGTDVVPSKYLILSNDDLRKAIATFDDAKLCDAVNEHVPDPNEEGDACSVYSMALSSEEDSSSAADPRSPKLTVTPPQADCVDRRAPSNTAQRSKH